MNVERILISNFLVFCICISYIPLITESAPPPEEHTSYIYSNKSVFVSEFYPTTNYNTGSNRYYLDVGEDEFTYSYVCLVEFDLSELPEDADIQTAEIGLYLAANPENIPVKMFKTREIWDEDTVTWNSKPSYKDFSKTQGLIDSITISTTGRSYWDATNTVSGWIDGTFSNYGVAFESTGEYFHRFSSDETTYHKPVLTVNYYSSGGSSGEPPEEPPEDSEPCEITYTISPESPQSGDSVTITATATDNIGLEYIIIKEGIIELCSDYSTDDETKTLTCSHTETLFPPGKTFIIEANDKGGSPPQSITLPISVEGSGSGPTIELSIDYRDQNAIPSHYRLLPGDNQTINITATATDPDGINFLTISVNGDLHDFSIVPSQTTVSRTVSVVNSDPSMDTFRYYASATDAEGYYTSESGEDIEIQEPFQWYWGLNFSNWGCDKNHTWSWDMMESIFGDSDIYLDKSKGWKKDWAWRLYDTKIRRGGRNGHCWGMCTLALELAHAPARITAHEIQVTATHIDALERDNWNHTWRYYYARQAGQYSNEVTPGMVAQYLDFHVGHWGIAYVGIHPYLEDLIDTISDDLENGRMGILSIKEEGKGHAVVPWRVVPGNSLERTYIYIYDPNHEAVSSDHSTNYADFELYPYIECNIRGRFGDGWWIYQWNDTSVWDEEIYYTPYSNAIGDESELNYIETVDITDHDIAYGISYLVSIGSGDSTYYAEDTNGRKTGIVKGNLVSEIPNSLPLIEYADSDSLENLMLFLPENEDLTFYFNATKDKGEYAFSINNENSTYSLYNKTISDKDEDKIIFKPGQSSGEYIYGLSGFGDSDYYIKISKEFKDNNKKTIIREYTTNKNSTNDKEDIEVSISKDKENLIIKNNNDENTSFDIELISTESLDNIDYIPSSHGSINLLMNQELIITANNWATTEIQANIIDVSDEKKINNETTPGFELIIMIFALLSILILWRKNQT